MSSATRVSKRLKEKKDRQSLCSVTADSARDKEEIVSSQRKQRRTSQPKSMSCCVLCCSLLLLLTYVLCSPAKLHALTPSPAQNNTSLAEMTTEPTLACCGRHSLHEQMSREAIPSV